MHYSKINTNVHYIRKKDNQDLIKKKYIYKKKENRSGWGGHVTGVGD